MKKKILMWLMAITFSSAVFADITKDEIDAVTYGIFNYKWSYLNEVDRLFSIKSPFWYTRLYNLTTAAPYVSQYESGIALKLGEGFEGPGGYLTFAGGFYDSGLGATSFSNGYNFDTNNGGTNYSSSGIQGLYPDSVSTNYRAYQFNALFATKLGDTGKLAFRLSAYGTVSNSSTPFAGQTERALTNGILVGNYIASLTNITANQDSYKYSFGFGFSTGGFDEKVEVNYTFNNNKFNYKQTNRDVQYTGDNQNTLGFVSRGVEGTTRGNATYGTASALKGVDVIKDLKHDLLEINTGNRFENVFGYDGRLYVSLNYAKAFFDDAANHTVTSVTTNLLANGIVTNNSTFTSDSTYGAFYQKFSGDLRIRKRIQLDEEKKVTFGVYPQYRWSYENAWTSRVRKTFLSRNVDVNGDGIYTGGGESSLQVSSEGAKDEKTENALTHTFLLPLGVDWKISKTVRFWAGAQAQYVVTQKWTTTKERETSLGSDVSSVVTNNNGLASKADDAIKLTTADQYSITPTFQDTYSVGLAWNPAPALEIVLTFSTTSPWTSAANGLLQGGNVGVSYNF